ncbi:MAG: efflux RND transporter permease subunit, partial [Parachlamydiaceae bacterium]
MNLSAPFINRPVMTTFVMLTIVLAGIVAFLKLPVSDLPTIERQNIQITTKYKGASPQTVLDLITVPLEKELTHIKGVEDISSTSSPGLSSIALTFALSKDMNTAIRDVQAALNTAEKQLPKDLDSRPSYRLEEKGQEPIMFLLITSESANVAELNSYADAYIIPKLERLEGVAQVVTYGSTKSIWLKLNPELMASRRISFNQVVNTIKQHTEQIPLGSIQTGTKQLSIELPQTVKRPQDLENVKISGTSVRLKDIGEISDKSKKEKEFRFVTKEKTSKAVILALQKVSDGNTVAISEAVHKILPTIQKELPPSISLNLWFDKAVWIKESLVDVQWTLALAFVLVVLVIYFSLGRISESIITSAALPLSLVGTFAIMYLANFSLDLLSLLALTLCVGFVVDDAIVVLENIVRWQEKGSPPREASLLGSKQICFTILSMTLSLVAVFIPLLFMDGMNGRLFREFSITLAAAILVSGFISLTLTPMLCSRYLSIHKEQSPMQKSIANANNRMITLYGKTLKICFRFPKTIILMALFSVGATIFLFNKLPVNLIPSEDRSFFFALVQLPAGMGSEQVKEQQEKLEELIRANPHIDTFLDLNFNDKLFFIIRLHHITNRPPQAKIMADVQKTIDSIPGTQTFIQPYQLINMDIDFGNPGQYQLVLRGMEFSDVEKADAILIQALQSHPEFSFARSSLKNDSPMLTLEINEEIANQLGFEKKQIQELLQYAYGQLSVGSIQQGGTSEKILLELLPEYQNSTNAPSKLYLETKEGNFVPLKGFVEWKETLGSASLKQRDQLPSSTVHFSLAPGIHPNIGLQLAENIAAEVLPANVSATLDGSAKAISSTVYNTLLLLA